MVMVPEQNKKKIHTQNIDKMQGFQLEASVKYSYIDSFIANQQRYFDN